MTTALAPPARQASAGGAPSRRGGPLPVALALGGWAALVAGAHLWGRALAASGHTLLLDLPPLHATLDPRLPLLALPAAAVGATVLVLGPRIAARTGFPCLLLYGMLAALLWAQALALVDGPEALVSPLLSPYDYLHDVSLVGSPVAFLSTFTDRLPQYVAHVRGHPPGLLLVLAGLHRLGLGDPGLLAGLLIAAGASSVPAALLAVREVAGEDRARAAAPFLAAAPAAIWVATSADALFMGVGAWAVALTVLATGRQGRRSALLAASGGLLFGAALLLTYGAVLLALVPAAVATARRRIAPLLWAGAGAAAVGTGFLAAGFAWWEGLAETRRTYLAGAGGKRPGGYFLLANPAALGLAVGPAAAVGLARLRDGRVWLLAGGALAAVALADISGMSRGEVERIWLPFVPWLLTACAALGRRAASRLWLALHLASGLGLQLLVRAPW